MHTEDEEDCKNDESKDEGSKSCSHVVPEEGWRPGIEKTETAKG